MANNYLKLTVSPDIPLTLKQLDVLSWDPDDAVIDEDGIPFTTPPVQDHEQALLDRFAYSLGMNYGDHLLGLTAEPQSDGTYYLYAEDGCPLEPLAELLQHVLKGLPTKDYPHIEIEYSWSCSKMRRGEFGGGAAFITRDSIEWNSTSWWLASKRDELARQFALQSEVDIKSVLRPEGPNE